MISTTQIIAKQGWVYSFALFVALVLSVYCGWGVGVLLFFVGFLCCLLMFRNPERVREDSDDVFVAPVDGVVRDIRYKSSQIVIVIETRMFDVGVIRAPCDVLDGRMSEVKGLTLSVASKDRQNTLNASMCFENLQGKKFTMNFFPVFLDSHSMSNSQSLRVGDRMGFMKMGMTHICVPQGGENSELDLNINIGDRIYALQSSIGYFK